MADEAVEAFEGLLGEAPSVPPIQEKLGATLTEVDEGEATFAMEASRDQHNMVDVVHGGVLTSLAELAASVAVLTTLDDDEAFTFVSQTTHYERPVVEGRVEAHAEVARRGSRITFVAVRLEQDGGESARAEFTALVQGIEVG
jgi:uncharacterized protein (TIGR00369 family)